MATVKSQYHLENPNRMLGRRFATLQPGINSRLGPKTDQHIHCFRQDERTPRLCAFLPGPGPQRRGCTGRHPIPTRNGMGQGLRSRALLQ